MKSFSTDSYMNYSEFLHAVEADMRSRFDDSYSLKITPVLRNNDTALDGLIIFSEKSNISPTIYLNPYFHRYLDGVAFSDICEDIYETYRAHRPTCVVDLDEFEVYDKVKDKIVLKLINYERNRTLLADVPHIRHLDLAIVFQLLLRNDYIGSGTILIHQDHMELWGVDVETLYDVAKVNSPRLLPSVCTTMVECLRDFTEELDATPEELDACKMLVLTNTEKTHGAAAILYEHVLQDIADQLNSDYIVFPSSIHEVILLPVEDEEDADYFNRMVRDINETQLQDDEILSDHAYLYSRKDSCLMPIAS